MPKGKGYCVALHFRNVLYAFQFDKFLSDSAAAKITTFNSHSIIALNIPCRLSATSLALISETAWIFSRYTGNRIKRRQEAWERKEKQEGEGGHNGNDDSDYDDEIMIFIVVVHCAHH